MNGSQRIQFSWKGKLNECSKMIDGMCAKYGINAKLVDVINLKLQEKKKC